MKVISIKDDGLSRPFCFCSTKKAVRQNSSMKYAMVQPEFYPDDAWRECRSSVVILKSRYIFIRDMHDSSEKLDVD